MSLHTVKDLRESCTSLGVGGQLVSQEWYDVKYLWFWNRGNGLMPLNNMNEFSYRSTYQSSINKYLNYSNYYTLPDPPADVSGPFNCDCVSESCGRSEDHWGPSGSSPGAATEVSLLCPHRRWRVALFIEKQTNHNRKLKYLPSRTRGRAGDEHRPEWGEQSPTVERRPTGAERQLYAGGRQEEAEWCWNVKYCRNVMYFHKCHRVPAYGCTCEGPTTHTHRRFRCWCENVRTLMFSDEGPGL